jgi:hypothetical protein
VVPSANPSKAPVQYFSFFNLNKRKRILKGQSKMDNLEKLTT